MQFWKKLLDHTCRVYTVTAMLMLLLNLSEDTLLSAPAFLRVFWFALSFAFANVIYSMTKMRKGVRLLIHCAFVVAGAFVFLYLPVARDTRASMKLVMLLLVALIYWVSMALYWVVSTLFRKAAPEPKPEYKSVFKK